MSRGIVQKVFEYISLRDRIDLWMSDEEHRFLERVEYLVDFPEIQEFREAAEKSIDGSRKNQALAEAFKEKAQEQRDDDLNKALKCLDKAITLAEHQSHLYEEAKQLRQDINAQQHKGQKHKGSQAADAEIQLAGIKAGLFKQLLLFSP